MSKALFLHALQSLNQLDQAVRSRSPFYNIPNSDWCGSQANRYSETF